MFHKVFSLFCIIIATIEFVNPANILCIYPRPAYSHQNVFRAITEKLLERGHRVTLLSTHPSDGEKRHENVTLIDASESVAKFNVAMDDIFRRRVTGFRAAIFHMIDSEAELVDAQLNTSQFQTILSMDNPGFDVMILEAAGFSPYHAIAEKFKIPVIGVSSADSFNIVHDVMGNPTNAIANPDRVMPFRVAETLKQRLGSVLINIFMDLILIPHAAEKHGEILRKHFPHVKKSHDELVQNIDFLMINAHPALGFVRPLLANTVQLGFLHVKPPKKLPEDLQKSLDQSTRGTIYMSFGTIVSEVLFKNHLEVFLEAFSHLPYDVYWKFDGKFIADVPKNVNIRKWYPQSDLLAHENIKLFITHGGLHSIEESILRRVPMVVCPFHGDQHANAERVIDKGIAVTLDIHRELTADEIIAAIHTVIDNVDYKSNIEKLADIVEDVPMTSADKAAWHVEYVIRHRGASHLAYPQKHIPFYQYHYWDVIAVILALTLCFILVLYWIVAKIIKCFRGYDNSSVDQYLYLSDADKKSK